MIHEFLLDGLILYCCFFPWQKLLFHFQIVRLIFIGSFRFNHLLHSYSFILFGKIRRILRSLRFLFPFLPFGTLLQNFLLLFGRHGFESTHGHFGCGVINLQYFGSRTHFVSSNYHHVDKFVFCLNYFFVTCWETLT